MKNFKILSPKRRPEIRTLSIEGPLKREAWRHEGQVIRHYMANENRRGVQTSDALANQGEGNGVC